MGGRDVDSVESLVEYVRREDVLSTLGGEGARRDEVEEAAGVSESTAHRILDRFIEDGIAERKERGVYRLTPVGEAVLSEVRDFCKSVRKALEVREITEAASEDGVGFEPSLFDPEGVTVSTRERPYEPARRFVEAIEDSSGLRLVAASSAVPVFSPKARRLLDESEGAAGPEVICPKGTAESAEFHDGLSVRAHPDPSLSVGVFDERVCVGGHADDGSLSVLALSSDDEVCDWGERVYRAYREDSSAYP